jgi:hypothetical protein
MTYLQHRNHVADGTDPWPGCQFCEAFIIQPAIREYRGEYRSLKGRVFVDLDGAELDELAAVQAA